ncbi:hypothetical protein OJF2_31220 [Aquisphaera giovannonii]|uniref:Uncharacterized protein n=1 Tax=Aquisphaera giovannonii TaxID=406548 RepID=A0A5B9W3B4_9BACT|nr:hypothetical protein OJF2_31220 [Aquisphaera giovannonii]
MLGGPGNRWARLRGVSGIATVADASGRAGRHCGSEYPPRIYRCQVPIDGSLKANVLKDLWATLSHQGCRDLGVHRCSRGPGRPGRAWGRASPPSRRRNACTHDLGWPSMGSPPRVAAGLRGGVRTGPLPRPPARPRRGRRRDRARPGGPAGTAGDAAVAAAAASRIRSRAAAGIGGSRPWIRPPIAPRRRGVSRASRPSGPTRLKDTWASARVASGWYVAGDGDGDVYFRTSVRGQTSSSLPDRGFLLAIAGGPGGMPGDPPVGPAPPGFREDCGPHADARGCVDRGLRPR